MAFRKITYILLIVGISALVSCNIKGSNEIDPETVNSKSTLDKPYLILISLDGFRWDYVERFKPPNLINFINSGVQAESLIPSFPSKTFPNHYTIATGLYPDKHGLLGNLFYNYEKDQFYNIRDREKVEDGDYYKGSPIWVQASKAGMISASYFFVGTEADIQGIHPTYYYDFDGSVKNDLRVDQVLKWLEKPEERRPHLITMYFSDTDKTGHSYGPNASQQLKQSIFGLDTVLGKLFDGIEKTGLPVNVIIVSDHGMKEIFVDDYIPIEKIINEELYRTVDNGSIVNIHPKNENQIDSIYYYLKEKEDNFKVFKTENTPYFEYVPKNKDWGSLQIIPDENYYFSSQWIIGLRKSSSRKVFGQHGFNPELKDMHGIFYANGPAFKERYVIPSIKNIHIFPLMCEILGLGIPDNVDGQLNEIQSVLIKN
jgi:predicted AlkP superfamily pyrophosphatase or phosphodiesterase